MGDDQSHLNSDLNEAMVCRSVWISDIHLGTKHARVAELLEFLRGVDCKYLYIVGDLIDGWELKFRWFWRDDYNLLIQKLLRKSRKQTRVIYISGNHDEFIEQFIGMGFGNVTMAREAIHTAADGRRYLVTHGDLFDIVIRHARWLAYLGDKAYDAAIAANTIFNKVRRGLGLRYWSLSQWAKYKVKNAVNFIGEFEKTLAAEASRHGLDGVICGHIHHAAAHDKFGFTYINCGDWVESCTAVGETFDGRFEIINWADLEPQVETQPAMMDAEAA